MYPIKCDYTPVAEEIVLTPLGNGLERVSFAIPTETELAFVRVMVQQTVVE